jgi:hypothetical protein
VRLTASHCKKKLVTKQLTEPRTWMDSLDKRPKRQNMDMRFGSGTQVVCIDYQFV